MKKVGWRCASNIALVKYWGKKAGQIPCNASVSMTLSKSYTETIIEVRDRSEGSDLLQYLFGNQPNPGFESKIEKFIKLVETYIPVLKSYTFIINSNNTFPHSAGIASSASSFGALALGLLSIADYKESDFYQKASFLARLGSGSACRSLYGGYTQWGEMEGVEHSSDEFAQPLQHVHPDMMKMNDAILIIDDQPKKVSSSVGHALMEGHVYAKDRFVQANHHAHLMLDVIKSGDFQQFCSIIEQEALALHAMMMTSSNAYILMKPGTIWAIEEIRKLREEEKLKVCFTLDAGPNVHVIFPEEDKKQIVDFLELKLRKGVKDIIYDEIGDGPKQILT